MTSEMQKAAQSAWYEWRAKSPSLSFTSGMAFDAGYEAGWKARAAAEDGPLTGLLDAIEKFRSELYNPAPDALYRNVLRKDMFAKAAALSRIRTEG